MPGRKLRDESDARSAVSSVESSGLSGVAWARANGVDARSLHAWRLVLRRRSTPSPPPLRMVELIPSSPRPEARYRVHVGTLTVEVDGDFDPEVLQRLLSVVSSC